MKKHKTIENDRLMERLCDEFNESTDIRNLAIISLLYVEYYLNEIIITIFDEPNLIIDETEIGSFDNKLKILKAYGIFKSQELVLNNITLIQRIRNYYAHHILKTILIP